MTEIESLSWKELQKWWDKFTHRPGASIDYFSAKPHEKLQIIPENRELIYNLDIARSEQMDAFRDGFEAGFKKARTMIIEELKNIAAQTDEQSLLQSAVHLEGFGER